MEAIAEVKSTFYPVTGEPREISPGHGRRFRNDELISLLGGDIEIVCTLSDGSMLIVCEESKRRGQSINGKATELYRSRVESKDFICGPAVVVLGMQF